MKWEDVDNKIGMPDVDAEWRRFESEIINQKPTSRRLLYWGISIAALSLTLRNRNFSLQS